MIRRPYLLLVALSLSVFSCNNKQTTGDNWKKVYENAYKNHDYHTGVVALNHLIITDSANIPAYYDSLAFYYIKKHRNFVAGKIIVDKGLKISPKNFNFLEYKSIFLNAEGSIAESREKLKEAYKLSGLKKHLYMYATTFATDKNIDEYVKIIDGFLYDPTTRPEQVEVSIDETSSQYVDIKALCYMDKAKIATNPTWIYAYLDSALMIAPDYQEALYYKEKFKAKK